MGGVQFFIIYVLVINTLCPYCPCWFVNEIATR